MNTTDPFDNVPIIHRYTRTEAMEDGVLIDLTDWAKETGFTIPVGCTASVWKGCVVHPEGTREFGQSETWGRGRHPWVFGLTKCVGGGAYGRGRSAGDRAQIKWEALVETSV